MIDLDGIACRLNETLNDELRGGKPAPEEIHALHIAEEAGEVIGAYRRYTGLARRKGTLEELSDELADVIIVASTFANRLGLNVQEIVDRKITKIYVRGWKE